MIRKNSNCDNQNGKNSKWDKNQKLKMWQNLITQNVAKLNLWPNSKTQILTKFLSNCDKTQIMTNLFLWEEKTNWKGLLNILTHWQPMQCVLRFSQCLVWYHNLKILFNPESYFCQWVWGIVPPYKMFHQ